MFTRLRVMLDRTLLVAVILLGLGLGGAAWLAFGPESAAPPTSRAIETAPGGPHEAPAPVSEQELARLWAGLDPERPPAADKAPGSAPAKTASPDAMHFALRGVIFSTTRPSVAFIQHGKRVGLYRVGQIIDGWEIRHIGRGGVTFAKDGKERQVGIASSSYADRGGAPLRTDAAQAARRSASPPSQQEKTPSLLGRSSRSRRFGRAVRASLTTPPSVKSFRPPPDADASVSIPKQVAERARTDPKSLMTGVELSVLRGKNGVMQGVSLDNVAQGSIAARYGLAPGDRIMAVNGESISSPARAAQLYQRFRGNDSVTVTLERNGQRKNVVYYVR